jgi:hypothetical protein
VHRANVKARLAAILLGILFLLCVLLLITSIWTVRTGSFELLAIGGAAVTLAGTLPVEELCQSRKDSLSHGTALWIG